jgi:galactokinase
MLTAALETEFGPADDSARVEIVRAPGRVNLIGDGTDYNDGFVLSIAAELDTWIAFRRRQDGHVRVTSRHSRETCSFRIDELTPGQGAAATSAPSAISVAAATSTAGRPTGGWSDYVAGAAWSLREAALPVRGFDGVIDTAMPIGAGFSSSSALEVASVLALLGGEQILSAPALAALAQRAERDYLGINCGIVDQFASAAGREGRALLLDLRSLDARHVALPFGLSVVVCDTGYRRESHATVDSTRRAECARAVALLSERIPGLCSLRDLDAASLRRHRGVLPENVASRAEHVVSENTRVVAAAAAMEAGDLGELCRLFEDSHASLRDRYEVSSPALEAMVEVARAIPGVVAAKMTGTGSAGCTVNLVLADAVPALQAAVGREYDRRTGLRGRVYPVAVVDGAGPVSTVEDRRVRGGGSGRFPVAV